MDGPSPQNAIRNQIVRWHWPRVINLQLGTFYFGKWTIPLPRRTQFHTLSCLAEFVPAVNFCSWFYVLDSFTSVCPISWANVVAVCGPLVLRSMTFPSSIRCLFQLVDCGRLTILILTPPRRIQLLSLTATPSPLVDARTLLSSATCQAWWTWRFRASPIAAVDRISGRCGTVQILRRTTRSRLLCYIPAGWYCFWARHAVGLSMGPSVPILRFTLNKD